MKLPTKETLGPEAFTDESLQTFKEETIPVVHTLFQRIDKEEMLPNSFYKARKNMIPKYDKTLQEKKL